MRNDRLRLAERQPNRKKLTDSIFFVPRTNRTVPELAENHPRYAKGPVSTEPKTGSPRAAFATGPPKTWYRQSGPWVVFPERAIGDGIFKDFVSGIVPGPFAST